MHLESCFQLAINYERQLVCFGFIIAGIPRMSGIRVGIDMDHQGGLLTLGSKHHYIPVWCAPVLAEFVFVYCLGLFEYCHYSVTYLLFDSFLLQFTLKLVQ